MAISPLPTTNWVTIKRFAGQQGIGSRTREQGTVHVRLWADLYTDEFRDYLRSHHDSIPRIIHILMPESDIEWGNSVIFNSNVVYNPLWLSLQTWAANDEPDIQEITEFVKVDGQTVFVDRRWTTRKE